MARRRTTKRKKVTKGKIGKRAKFVLRTSRALEGGLVNFSATIGGASVGNINLQRDSRKKDRGRLSNFVVAPEFQERGIGLSLVKKALHHCWKSKPPIKILEVRPWPKSRGLFKSLGFEFGALNVPARNMAIDVEEYFERMKREKHEKKKKSL